MIKFPDIDPVIFRISEHLAITWYSMSYVVGILLGWFFAKKIIIIKNNNIINYNKNINQITPNMMDDFVNWIIFGIIIGGRLGYVIFYDPIKYLQDPIDILKTYEGGMSFHGGILGYIISSYIFAIRRNVSFLALTDISSLVAPIAIGFGRIANFINAELYGRVTDVSWGVVFPNSDLLPRHPSQLYEALLEGLLLLVIVNYCAFKKQLLEKVGVISAIFLIFYSLFRIIIEFYREPDIQIGFIIQKFTLGQLLSIPMFITGCIIMIQSFVKQKSK